MTRFLAVSFLLIVLVGCAAPTSRRAAPQPMPDEPKVNIEPTIPEEEIVKKWIVENGSNPSSLRFVRWGPHDLEGELGKLKAKSSGQEDDKDFRVVRVVFWFDVKGKWSTNDTLFWLKDNEVKFSSTNLYGEDWQQAEKRMYLNAIKDAEKRGSLHVKQR